MTFFHPEFITPVIIGIFLVTGIALAIGLIQGVEPQKLKKKEVKRSVKLSKGNKVKFL